MTQEDKELLLKDLFARLPYGAFVQFEVDGQKTIKPLTMDFLSSTWYHTEWIKPYLRPMSSMTEEEKNVFHKIVMKFNEYELFYYNLQNRNFYEYLFTYTSELLDWLHAHHFDYRGLIEKGLALEAPKDMYNI